MNLGSPTVPRIPADRLYWARLPAGLHGDARAFAAERVLPEPIEALHWVAAELPSGGCVFAGIPPETLRVWLADHVDAARHTWQVLPDHLPASVSSAIVDHAVLPRLNLLIGPFEPSLRRRWRHLVVIGVIIGMVAAILLVVVGVERRVAHLRAEAESWNAASSQRIARAVGLPADAPHPELRLTQELRRLDQLGIAHAIDVPAMLQALLSTWPRDLATQVDSIAVDDGRVMVRATVPGMTEAERLATALAQVQVGKSTWRAEPVQMQTSNQTTSLVVTLLPTNGRVKP